MIGHLGRHMVGTTLSRGLEKMQCRPRFHTTKRAVRGEKKTSTTNQFEACHDCRIIHPTLGRDCKMVSSSRNWNQKCARDWPFPVLKTPTTCGSRTENTETQSHENFDFDCLTQTRRLTISSGVRILLTIIVCFKLLRRTNEGVTIRGQGANHLPRRPTFC